MRTVAGPLACLLLLAPLASAAPLPCLGLVLPAQEHCEQGPNPPGVLLRVVPFVDGHAVRSFRLAVIEPDSKIWVFIEVAAWDAPFRAHIWGGDGIGGGISGFTPGAEVTVAASETVVEVRHLVAVSSTWIGFGWTFQPGNHLLRLAAASEGALEGRFTMHYEGEVRLLAEAADGVAGLRRLRDFERVAQAYGGVPLVWNGGVGAAVEASLTVEVRRNLLARLEGWTEPAHAGWWGFQGPDGAGWGGPCANAMGMTAVHAPCRIVIRDGAPGAWRFDVRLDAGAGIDYPEPVLFFADVADP